MVWHPAKYAELLADKTLGFYKHRAAMSCTDLSLVSCTVCTRLLSKNRCFFCKSASRMDIISSNQFIASCELQKSSFLQDCAIIINHMPTITV